MRNILRTARKLVTQRDVALLYSATLFATAGNFVANVLITRVLGVQLFGDWKYLQSTVVLISHLLHLGVYYTAGRLISLSDRQAATRVQKGYMMTHAAFSTVVMLGIVVGAGRLSADLIPPALLETLFLVFPLLISVSIGYYIESAYQAERKVRALATYRLLPSLCFVVALFILQDELASSVSWVAALFYGVSLAVALPLIIADRPIFVFNHGSLKSFLEEHRRFGLQLYHGSLWSTGVAYTIPLLIGILGTENKEVGFYALAQSFVAPISLLPAIIGVVKFNSYVSARSIPLNHFLIAAAAGGVVLLIIVLSINYLVTVAFGSAYKSISMLVSIGALGALLHGMGDFTNKFLMAKGEAAHMKKTAILVGTIQLTFACGLIPLYAALGAVVAQTLGSAVFFISSVLHYYRRYVKISKP